MNLSLAMAYSENVSLQLYGVAGTPCPRKKGVLHFEGRTTCVFCLEAQRLAVRAWWARQGIDIDAPCTVRPGGACDRG